MSGVVSRQLHSDPTLQLVYVNNRIIQKSRVHKLVIELIKKYGNVWGIDRGSSQEIVDVEGYVFIVKILCPYQCVNFTRSGRKTSAEFGKAEEVLKCVHRAVKGSLKAENADSSLCGSWWMGPEKAREKGNPVFGTSQLHNVVRGQRVLRVVKNPEGALCEMIPNPAAAEEKVCERTGIQGLHIVREREVLKELSQKNLEQSLTKRSIQAHRENGTRKRLHQERNQGEISHKVSETPGRSDEIQRYCEAFFYESSREGTALAENAPIFEMQDFPQVPFHDFLAWLKVKASHDSTAMKLLTEFSGLKSGRHVACDSEALPLVSLKDIRKEKFALRSKVMLKRIEEAAGTRRMFSQSENKENEYPETFKHPLSVSRKVVQRETTTYTRTPKWPTPVDPCRQTFRFRRNAREVSQVSFNEFLTWLKFKASHDTTTNRLLNEFIAFKFRRPFDQPDLPLISLKEVRREKLALRSRLLLNHIRGNARNRGEVVATKNVSEGQIFSHHYEESGKSRSEIEQRRESQEKQNREIVSCRCEEAAGRNQVTEVLKNAEKKRKRTYPSVEEEEQTTRKRQCHTEDTEVLDEVRSKSTHLEKVEKTKTMTAPRKTKRSQRGQSVSPRKSTFKIKQSVREDIESPFFTTWNSHYRNGNDPDIRRIQKILEDSSVPAAEQSLSDCAMIEEELKGMNERAEVTLSPKFIASTNTIFCKEVLPHSQPSSVISEPLCSEAPEFDTQVCEKTIERGGCFGIPVYSTLSHFSDHPHVQLESSIHYTVREDKEIQACPIVNDASTQVFSKSKKLTNVSVQTSPTSPFARCDKQVQTSQTIQEAKDTPHSQHIILHSQTQSRSTEELPCGQQPGVGTNANSSETPLPVVLKPNGPESEEMATNLLNTAPAAAVDTTPDSNLPDTVPVIPSDHWEERKDEFGRSFFVHSTSGFTAFDPPASSTRFSFPLRTSVFGASQKNPAGIPLLEQRGRDELRAAVTDSCEDYLGNIKWSGNDDGMLLKSVLLSAYVKVF